MQKRSVSRAFTLVLTTTLLVAGVQVPSFASTDAGEVAATTTVPLLAPIAGELVAEGDSFHGDMTTGTIEVSQALAGDITVNLPEGSAELPLPNSSTHKAGIRTGEDTVLYANTEGDFDVEVVAGAEATRVQTIIQSADAPIEYVYEFTNTTVIVEDGAGGAIAFNPSLESDPNVYIAAPWAIDANGAAVATHYEIRGSALVQIVDHNAADVAYPVTADPTYSFGLGIYAHFNKAETKTVSQMGATAAIVTAACTAVGAAIGPWGAAAGAVGCGLQASAILYQSTLAVNSNKCFYMRAVGVPILNQVLIYPGTYNDNRCK